MLPIKNIYSPTYHTIKHSRKCTTYNTNLNEEFTGFIGAGRMAQALAGGFVGKGLMSADKIIFYDPDQTSCDHFSKIVPGAISLKSTCEVIKQANVIILAVKPDNIEKVGESLIGKNKENKLFISILAGITLKSLYNHLQTKRIVRVMPNTPCLIGEGASGYALGADATKIDGDTVKTLLQAVGIALQFKEKHLDAVTGVSGTGPVYTYEQILASTDAGVLMGLSRKDAFALSVQAAKGAILMIEKTGLHPAILTDQVTSPGGTTATARQLLERRGFKSSLIDAIEAATKKSEELGRS